MTIRVDRCNPYHSHQHHHRQHQHKHCHRDHHQYHPDLVCHHLSGPRKKISQEKNGPKKEREKTISVKQMAPGYDYPVTCSLLGCEPQTTAQDMETDA